jgi:hypothetical protein
MTRCVFALVTLLFGTSVLAQSPHYHQVAKFTIGGEGGWDYVTYDPVQDRIFVAHNDAVLVVNASNGKRLGNIPAKGAQASP